MNTGPNIGVEMRSEEISLEKVTLKLKRQDRQELAKERETCTNAQIQENCWSWRLKFRSNCELSEEAQTSFCR